jgi:hypothetical protein
MNLEDREGMAEVGTGLLLSVHDCLTAQPSRNLHQCHIPAVFRPLANPPMPHVALALANCITGQPLKTTFGYVAALPGSRMLQ